MISSRTSNPPSPILFPSELSFQNACSLAKTIQQLPDEGRYILDLSPLQWIEPFAMLQVSTTVGQKVAACPDLTLQATGYTNGYARFMGFFRELGIAGETGGRPLENHENYLPIQTLNLREVRAAAEQGAVAPGQLVEHHSRSIARTLARQNHGRLWETLQYALREIIRNAAEHSESDHVLYCGQYWPTRNKVEVAILDEGVGIARSLRRNPRLQITDEISALRLSLQPGISGVAYEGAGVDDPDAWANSGFGLYIVSELCRRGGSLTILSGSTGLCVLPGEEREIEAFHSGTALRLIFDTSNLRSIAASLELIVARGEAAALENGLARPLASKASKRVFD